MGGGDEAKGRRGEGEIGRKGEGVMSSGRISRHKDLRVYQRAIEAAIQIFSSQKIFFYGRSS